VSPAVDGRAAVGVARAVRWGQAGHDAGSGLREVRQNHVRRRRGERPSPPKGEQSPF